MLKIKTLLLSLATVAGTAVAAQAVTLASFEITRGTYEVIGGQEINIGGNFSGDATGLLAADPNTALPLVFGADITVNNDPVFSGDTPPITASPLDLFFGAMAIGNALDGATGGVFSDAIAYMLTGEERETSNPGAVFGFALEFGGMNFGTADLFFSFSGGLTGPGMLQGSFSASIVGNAQNPFTLSELINMGLGQVDLSGTPLDGFVFPSNDQGTYSAAFSISAVPLPAGAALLLGGLLGFVALRRRRPA